MRNFRGLAAGWACLHIHYLKVVRATPVVRCFPVREEGQVAWLESPNGLGATAEFQLRGEVSRTKFPAILCRRSTSLGKRTDEQRAIRCLSVDAGADQQRPLDPVTREKIILSPGVRSTVIPG